VRAEFLTIGRCSRWFRLEAKVLTDCVREITSVMEEVEIDNNDNVELEAIDVIDDDEEEDEEEEEAQGRAAEGDAAVEGGNEHQQEGGGGGGVGASPAESNNGNG
jgi:Ran GTPase-activating protein (RanGAP) involved in mRNA processing and transport